MKVGDYVRFYNRSWTEIGKIVDEVEDSHLKVVECKDGYYDLDNFIKSSSNIIDLIEVGDYVNGERVKALKGDIENHKINNEDDVIYTEYINDYDEWCGFEKDEIKSIVTKEMYSSVEYRVEIN